MTNAEVKSKIYDYTKIVSPYFNEIICRSKDNGFLEIHDFRRLLEYGIPMVKILSDIYMITPDELAGKIKRKEITYIDVVYSLRIFAIETELMILKSK